MSTEVWSVLFFGTPGTCTSAHLAKPFVGRGAMLCEDTKLPVGFRERCPPA